MFFPFPILAYDKISYQFYHIKLYFWI